MKVLHVLDHSLPIQSGYAFRSAAILDSLRRLGVEVLAVTSPKHDSTEPFESGNVVYRRAWRRPLGDGVRGQIECVRETRRMLRSLVSSYRPDLVHAHSPCLNGLAALGLGVPLVYEIRSSWEDAAVSSGKTTEGSMRYRASRWLETLTAKAADQIVVICDGLLQDLRRRGIPEDRLTVVGNAIERTSLPPPERAEVDDLRRRLNLSGRTVLGFFGSFFRWEGLPTLIRALPILKESLPDVAVVLAGGGEDEPELRRLADELHVADDIRFVGRVPHSEVPGYYAMADFMVFPRRPIRIAEMVTPLKPLEAMHAGTVVIASDVGGHRELIEDGVTGVLFEPDNPAALAAAVLGAARDPALCERLARRASAYVTEERTWERMAERYLDVYGRVAGRVPCAG